MKEKNRSKSYKMKSELNYRSSKLGFNLCVNLKNLSENS